MLDPLASRSLCLRCGAPQLQDAYEDWLRERQQEARVELFPRLRRCLQEVLEAATDGQVLGMYLPGMQKILKEADDTCGPPEITGRDPERPEVILAMDGGAAIMLRIAVDYWEAYMDGGGVELTDKGRQGFADLRRDLDQQLAASLGLDFLDGQRFFSAGQDDEGPDFSDLLAAMLGGPDE